MFRLFRIATPLGLLLILLQIFRPQPDGTWQYIPPDIALKPIAQWTATNAAPWLQRAGKLVEAINREPCGKNEFLCEEDRNIRIGDAVRGK
jgi:hypothetical protein